MKQALLLSIFLFFSGYFHAQDTFSIVAVDTLTGEIGSAGASCLDNIQFPGSNGAIIISDILPGRGAIHTQSYWNATNQANARMRMEEGLSPQEVIAWLKANDAQGGFAWVNRQYGVVDFDAQGHPRSAALTGNGCLDWKGHRLGANYAIQGNILLGPQILDSMEARFLAATGSLSDRLMACLQGANVPGADSRCLQNGTSSLSAFIRVAKPGDSDDSLWLDLNVPSLPTGMEPIDSLQRLYNQWKTLLPTHEPNAVWQEPKLFPNPASGWFNVQLSAQNAQLMVFDLSGRAVFQKQLLQGDNRLAPQIPAGVYFVRIQADNQAVHTLRLVWTD
ncbi:MAG: DUF1028 domain-containing protein [Chitinophagales bacterium]|nr:DUF1028 domain-containing protein [Chitinophagales bacterium]